MRELTYIEAINEAQKNAMELSEDVVVMGQYVDSKAGIFGTTTGLVDEYGTDRVQDYPISEAGMTMAGMGAALEGVRPILCHQRTDFMLHSMDAIGNWLSLWYFKSNRKGALPVTIRMVVGKGWGQGPQHSKSIHAWFAHVPGIQVAMPATPFDAKGLLLESVFGETPTIIVEGRSLFTMKEHVPEVPYRVRFGEAKTHRVGGDVTIVGIGMMLPFALRAADLLAKKGIEAEVIDPRSIKPLDKQSLVASVEKTTRLVVCDPAWKSFGVSSEIMAVCLEDCSKPIKAQRVTLPDSHTPVSQTLESAYYPTEQDIVDKVKVTLP